MTRDEILNMPAGCEMDALIAKYVMKLERTKPGQWRESVDWWVNGLPSECPDYSTDISAAWEVVEKFDNHCMLNNVHGTWECHLPNGRIGMSQSAPLAICRAALLAGMAI